MPSTQQLMRMFGSEVVRIWDETPHEKKSGFIEFLSLPVRDKQRGEQPMTDATDVMAQDIEALRRERDRLQADRDAVADALRVPKHEGIATLVRIATEYREKFYKGRERADALAAHVDAAHQLLGKIVLYLPPGPHTFGAINAWKDLSPTTSLARRDARMKAEALERAAEEAPSGIGAHAWKYLRYEATKLRRQAEERR